MLTIQEMAQGLKEARFPKGVPMTVDEVSAVVGPEFKEMNENPPPEVVKVREEMEGKTAGSESRLAGVKESDSVEVVQKALMRLSQVKNVQEDARYKSPVWKPAQALNVVFREPEGLGLSIKLVRTQYGWYTDPHNHFLGYHVKDVMKEIQWLLQPRYNVFEIGDAIIVARTLAPPQKVLHAVGHGKLIGKDKLWKELGRWINTRIEIDVSDKVPGDAIAYVPRDWRATGGYMTDEGMVEESVYSIPEIIQNARFAKVPEEGSNLKKTAYFSVVLPPGDTKWHSPRQKTTRGAFKTEREAHEWAKRNVPHYDYTVEEFSDWQKMEKETIAVLRAIQENGEQGLRIQNLTPEIVQSLLSEKIVEAERGYLYPKQPAFDRFIQTKRIRLASPQTRQRLSWELKESGYRPYRSQGGDPFWMKAKYPGTAEDGTSFKRGADILYWPRTKTIMVGKKAEAAWRKFESEAADEDFMSRAAGSEKRSGEPDGTGPCKDSPKCPHNKEASIKSEAMETTVALGQDPKAVVALIYFFIRQWAYGADIKGLMEDFARVTLPIHKGKLKRPSPVEIQKVNKIINRYARGSIEESEAVGGFIYWALFALGNKELARKARNILLKRMAGFEKEGAAQGLYGFTKGTQRDCEATIKKIHRHAAKIAKAVYARDEGVAGFLATHSKRASSLPAKILVAEIKNLGPKFAAEKQAASSSSRSLYGFGSKTATLGLNACAELRAFVGTLAEDLHERRKERYAHITGFFQSHAKKARNDCARLIMSCYPVVDKAPTRVKDWL